MLISVHVYKSNVEMSSLDLKLSPSRIIADTSIACDRKVPFARILTFTYLLTERDCGQACATIAQNMLALHEHFYILSSMHSCTPNQNQPF